MALTIKKSMDVATFWQSWLLVTEMVMDEFAAVKGHNGFYELTLELIWDYEEEEIAQNDGDEDTRPICPVCGLPVSNDDYWYGGRHVRCVLEQAPEEPSA